MVFFEDLFDIGYNGNRYGHNPKDTIGVIYFYVLYNTVMIE